MNQIVDHAHCEICQAVIKPAERTCSLECTEKLQEATNQKKKSMILLVAIIVIVVIITKIPSPF